MTIQSQTTRVDYTGNGATTTFPVPFYWLQDTDLLVIRTDNGFTPPTAATLALGTDYLVTGSGNQSGGSITTTVAPTATQKLSILRSVPFTQLTHYVPNDPFPAASHEQALDKLTMETQQLNEGLSRSITLPPNATGLSTNLPLPAPNNLIGWNPAANALQNVDPTTIATSVTYGNANGDLFSGNGATVNFNLSANPGGINNLDVSISGVTQRPGIDYTWNAGTTITFTTAPPAGTNNILVRYTQALPIGTTAAGNVNYDSLGLDAIIRTRLYRLVDSVATMVSLDTTKYQFAETLGYYTAADGGAARYRYNSASSATANGGTVIMPASGIGRWELADTTYVTSRHFGAKGDKVTDDAAALRAYILWCLSFSTPRTAIISGTCLVGSSINIDRPVSTTTSEFKITNDGTESGFYIAATVTIFDSTLTMTTDPVSENVVLQNLRFEAANPGGAGGYVMSAKFLRVKVLNCYFHRINFMTSSIYLQSMYFQNCTARYHPSTFINADHAFDITVASCITEFGGGYLLNLPNGGYNVRLVDGCHEGASGGIVSGGGFRSLKVSGYYAEGNALSAVSLSFGPQNYAVSVTDCLFYSQAGNASNVNFYEIDWGNTLYPVSRNNNQLNGRLHGVNSLPVASGSGVPSLDSSGDTATLALASNPLYLKYASGTFALATSIAGSTLNYATYRRNGTEVLIEFNITVVTSGSGSPVTFTGLPYGAINTVFGGEVVYTGITGEVDLYGGTGVSLTATSFGIYSTKQGAGINYATASGKNIVGKLKYQI